MAKFRIFNLLRAAKRILPMSDQPNLDRKSSEVSLKVADAAKRSAGEDIDSAWARFEERKQVLRNSVGYGQGPRP